MDIFSRLLKIAKQKSIHIMALFFTTGLILILREYSFQKTNDILFLDSIPDSVGWIISIVFIFCGFLLILNFFAWCKHKINNRIKIDPIEQRILEYFTETGLDTISKEQMLDYLSITEHSLQYHIEKLFGTYIDTNDDLFNPYETVYWLLPKGRKLLAKKGKLK